VRSFGGLDPRTPFATNWHVELIAAKLAAVRAGHIRRLIVSLPPRHLKSHLASMAFPAWCLGHEPSTEILCVSYAQALADKLSRDCRRILASDWYQRLFPTRLAPRHQAVPEFETTAQGSRVATSVGGVLTGRGADIHRLHESLPSGVTRGRPRRPRAGAGAVGGGAPPGDRRRGRGLHGRDRARAAVLWLQGSPRAFGIARYDREVGARRLVWLGAALFPVTKRAEGDLVTRGKFLLGQAECAP
jgi:hypothetical protein